MGELVAPVEVVPGIVLMHGFFGTAVESEIVFVGVKSCERAEDSFVAGFFVDSCFDGEVEHCFHF